MHDFTHAHFPPETSQTLFSVTHIPDNSITKEDATLAHQHLSPTCFLSRETHLDSMEPRVMLGSMWFRTFARKTCKQRKTKHAGALHCLFSHINTSLKNFLSLSFFLAICRVLQRDTVTELWVCVPRNSPSVFSLYVYVSQDPKTHFNLLKQTNNADFDTSLVLRLVQKKTKKRTHLYLWFSKRQLLLLNWYLHWFSTHTQNKRCQCYSHYQQKGSVE